jgi:hypothetical protein
MIKSRMNINDRGSLKETFDFIVYRDRKKLDPQRDYRINWRTLELEMIHPYFNYVYNVGIYANQKYLKEYVELSKRKVKKKKINNRL